MSTHTDYVLINGQLKPWQGVPGHIETIQFTDGNFSIGSASATAAASTTSASSTAEVDKLNAASTLSASKKDELAKAAKKINLKGPAASANKSRGQDASQVGGPGRSSRAPTLLPASGAIGPSESLRAGREG
jgi:hypothetical protein